MKFITGGNMKYVSFGTGDQVLFYNGSPVYFKKTFPIFVKGMKKESKRGSMFWSSSQGTYINPSPKNTCRALNKLRS